MELGLPRLLDVNQLIGGDRFIHRTSDTLTLLRYDHAALRASLPKGVRLMADRDARAAYGHTPSQLPNEIPRPDGIR